MERRIEDKSIWEGRYKGDALQRGQLTGTHRFIDEVEQRLGIRVEQRKQGRPKKSRIGETNHV